MIPLMKRLKMRLNRKLLKIVARPLKTLIKGFRRHYYAREVYNMWTEHNTALYRIVNNDAYEMEREIISVIQELYDSNVNGCIAITLSRTITTTDRFRAIIDTDLLHYHRYGDVIFIAIHPYGVSFGLGNRYDVVEIINDRPEYIFNVCLDNAEYMGDMCSIDGTVCAIYCINELCEASLVASFINESKYFLSKEIGYEVMAFATDEYRKIEQERHVLALKQAIASGEISHYDLSDNPMEDYAYNSSNEYIFQ